MNHQSHTVWARAVVCIALVLVSFSWSPVTAVRARSTTAPAAPYTAPTADAGADQSVSVNTTVTLDGTLSSDFDNQTPLTYGWLQTGGPTITLSDATANMPTFSASTAPTIITFTLTVTDTANEVSVPDQVIITINDIPINGTSASSSSPTLISQATQFTGSVTAGSNVQYLWNFGDGNSSVQQSPSHVYTQPGVYTAIVTASNSAGFVSANTHVQIVNRAPAAAIGASTTLTVYIDEAGNLDASGSSDPDEPPPFAYAYVQTGGPAVTLTDGSYQATGFIAPSAPATLTFLLTISDTYGLTGTTSISINVINRPITWIASDNSSPNALGVSTVFTALSTGSNVTFTWNFGDGSPLAFGDLQAHTYAQYGTYNAVVTATNTQGFLTSGTIVKILNPHPTANAGTNQSVPVNSTVTLNGSASNDLNGDVPLSYFWTQLGGPAVSLTSQTTVTPSFLAPAIPAILTFTLQVTDSTGLPALSSDSVTIFVSDGTILGLNILSDDPSYLGAATHFTAALGAGTNVTYAWTFGDGSTSTDATPPHTYASVGTYLVTVTATNSLGNAVATRAITITNPAPVANAGVDQWVSVGSSVILSGGLSSDLNNNLPLQFGWRQVGGTSIVLINANSATPALVAPSFPATLTFQLIVTDSFGAASLADTVTIKVANVAITGLTAQANTPTLLGSVTAFVASIVKGSNVAYTWSFGDGSTGSGIAPTHNYAQIGIYKAIVTATNDLGSVIAFANVEVKNLAPTVRFNATTLQVYSGERFTMNGSSSVDPNNNIPLTYRWQQVGGFQVILSNPNSATTSATAPRVATRTGLTFTLTVIDSVGAASVPGVVVVNVSPLRLYMPMARRG